VDVLRAGPFAAGLSFFAYERIKARAEKERTALISGQTNNAPIADRARK
jgi:hypothetical protein